MTSPLLFFTDQGSNHCLFYRVLDHMKVSPNWRRQAEYISLEIGPGVVGRVCSRLQREHLHAPRYRNGVTKWR